METRDPRTQPTRTPGVHVRLAQTQGLDPYGSGTVISRSHFYRSRMYTFTGTCPISACGLPVWAGRHQVGSFSRPRGLAAVSTFHITDHRCQSGNGGRQGITVGQPRDAGRRPRGVWLPSKLKDGPPSGLHMKPGFAKPSTDVSRGAKTPRRLTKRFRRIASSAQQASEGSCSERESF